LKKERKRAALRYRSALLFYLPQLSLTGQLAIARSDTYYCMAQASVQERDRQNKINTKTLNPTELHRNATQRYATLSLRFAFYPYPIL
jgi:hypothetical protein